MIYLIDEEEGNMAPYVDELRILDFEVTQITDADAAFEAIQSIDDAQLIIVDVMLSTRDRELSRFTADETSNFIRTGLVLIRKIAEARPDLVSCLVIFSMAAEKNLVSAIRKVSSDLGIPYLKKRELSDPLDFGDAILSTIKEKETP